MSRGLTRLGMFLTGVEQMTMTSAPARPRVDLWQGSVRGDASRVALAHLLDGGLIVVAAGAAVGAFLVGSPAWGWTFAVAAAAVAATVAVSLGRTGRTPGLRMVGMRTVSASDAMPLGARAFAARRTCDIRRGRDPVTPVFEPYAFPDVKRRETSGSFSRAAVIELDSGQHLPLSHEVVIGRSGPTVHDDETTFGWPDLSRTVSKAHARFEWDGTRAWVTDLGSTNGTFLDGPGATVAFAPFQRTALPPFAVIRLGSRRLTVQVPR